MSQSPQGVAASTDTPDLVRYREAWSALNQLIGRGGAFSGHERNCAFLNTGGPRFATVSAASGLDFDDDGRAVAVLDHDFDGDPDLVIANRTAPRLRLVRNDTRGGYGWVSIALQGVRSNRDAIGARVDLEVSSPSGSRRIVRTLRAGEGYLAQSSKTLTIGLGDATAIESLRVRWPSGGTIEEFRGVTIGHHHRLIEGVGIAETVTTPSRESLPADGIVLPPVDSASRTVIVGRVPLPEASWIPWDDAAGGAARSLDADRGRALLVNLWSTTCAPCVAELVDWTQNAGAIRTAGLDVIATCVDPGEPETMAKARDILGRVGFPFRAGRATTELVDALETVHRAWVELQKPLPVPTSVLIDREGRVAVIYKGRVELSRLLADARELEATDVARRESAVPFAGRWASATFPPMPDSIVETFELAGRPEAGAAYMSRYFESVSARGQEGRAELSKAAFAWGARLLGQGRTEEASAAWGRLLGSDPSNGPLHAEIGRQLLRAGQLERAAAHLHLATTARPDDADSLYHHGLAKLGLRDTTRAIELFRAVVAVRPDDADARFHLGNTLHGVGRTAEAIPELRRATQAGTTWPGWTHAMNNLAWILATSPDDRVRDGHEAVRLAEEVSRATMRRDPAVLATLAAAYAEAGRFAEAVATNDEARRLAEGAGRPDLEASLTERAALYEAERPYRAEPR